MVNHNYLTHDEQQAAEAAFTGKPPAEGWSEAGKRVYWGLVAALNAASEWLNDMGCEHEEPDLTCVVCLVNAAINKAEG